jgi:hypothetical protein
MVLLFAACAEKESQTPETALQENGDANKAAALLQNRDSRYALRTGKA